MDGAKKLEEDRPDYQAKREEKPGWRSRLVKCRRTWAGSDPVVSVIRYQSGGIGVQGVARCGSLGKCPVCSRRAAAERAAELHDLVSRATGEHVPQEGGGHHYEKRAFPVMVTVTMHHEWSDNLAELRRDLATAWRDCFQGKAGQKAKGRFGILGTVRALEVTFGNHGAHPHLHVLALLETTGTDEGDDRRAADLEDWLRDRWQGRLAARSRRTRRDLWALRDVGVVVTRTENAEYIAKMGVVDGVAVEAVRRWGIGDEVAGGDSKSRTHWNLLADAIDGDRRAVHEWHRWCDTMHGARWLFWSHGLRKRFGVGERRREKLADAHVIGQLTPEDWNLFCMTGEDSRGARRVSALLDLLEERPGIDLDEAMALVRGAVLPQNV